MLFTSLGFLIFFIIVFICYWLFGNKKIDNKYQNGVLLIASYVFYGIAEWKMIPLLLTSTIVFYFLGICIGKNSNTPKACRLTTIGVVLGVGVLLYFKYFNFFIQSFSDLFNTLGFQTNWSTFKIIMPLGVSYFTFKLISYVIEIHRGKFDYCKDFVAFAAYISFFPTIMAGPIDRPSFIQQLQTKREFHFTDGFDAIQQILWGFFKKVAIADNLFLFINTAWENMGTVGSIHLISAALLYTFQMYADFSGYSDMAIGVGRLLGIRITKNFNYPFFATTISDFWRKWHISLTGWLTDYVFMPLNVKFRNLGKLGIILAIIINMVLVGMWHGANWTYAVFGLYQGLLFIPMIIRNKMNKKTKLTINRLGLPGVCDLLKMLGIFLLYTLGAIVFRAESLSQAREFICAIAYTNHTILPEHVKGAVPACMGIFIFMVVEWFQREKDFGLQFNSSFYTRHPFIIILLDYILICATIYIGNFGDNQFIYFQF